MLTASHCKYLESCLRLQSASQAGKERESKKAFIDTSGVPAPSTSSFRPPPGFMDALDANQQAIGPMDPEEARAALDKVRSQAGYWHELAKLFPRLAAAGYDSQVVEMETGLERKVQNSWIASSQVPSASLSVGYRYKRNVQADKW